MFLGMIVYAAMFFSSFLKIKKTIDILHIWNLWNLSFSRCLKRIFCSNPENLPISDTRSLAIGLHAQICLLACAAHWAARVFLVWLQ